MEGLSSSSFRCSGGKGRGGGGASRLYAFCMFSCLCFSAAVVGQVIEVAPSGSTGTAGPAGARPPPPVYASSPTRGVIDSSLYRPGDAHCLLAAIKQATIAILGRNRPRAASLLRLVFHDCMTRGGGCDSSILRPREINADNNESLQKVVPIITNIRNSAGRQCGVLPTMADTIARAAAAAVSFAGLGDVVANGFRLGRRDLAQGEAGDDPTTLPNENQSLEDILTLLTAFGLSDREVTVWSIGGHSIGVADCVHITPRLNNVTSSPSCLQPADPTLDPGLACRLARQCTEPSVLVNFDTRTPFVLDTSYFQLLLLRQGLIKSDQAFAGHPRTSGFISEYATAPTRFRADFLAAFVKVSLININGPTTAPPTTYHYP